MKITNVLVLMLLVIPSAARAGGGGQYYPELKTNKVALEKWRAMRFGLFIHWGPVSLKGTEIGWSRGKQIPREEYDNLYKRFNPTKFNADEWVGIAKAAGMKYLVITSKHHDGFSIWDSAYTDYDIMATPLGRDVLKELSDACKRQSIQFSVYYSILDWYHGDYLPQSHGGPHDGRSPKDADFERYVTYMKNQLAEIEKKYGPLEIFWFDGEWEKTWSPKRGADLYAYCRKLRDDVLINNRVGKGRQGMQGMSKADMYAGDYGTPEQEVGAFNVDVPWETCMTICTQWAWKPNDKMKSLKQCLRTLVTTVCGDGNLLFNVGPMPDGRIEPRQVQRLKEMGQWLGKYGESIYATRGGPFKPGKWGGSTHKGSKIYLHVFKTDNGKLELPAIDAKITGASLLTGGDVKVRQERGKILVTIAAKDLQDIDTIVVLELDKSASEIAPVAVAASAPPTREKKARASNAYKNVDMHAGKRIARMGIHKFISSGSQFAQFGGHNVISGVVLSRRRTENSDTENSDSREWHCRGFLGLRGRCRFGSGAQR